MIHEQRTIQETIDFLNELVVIDEPTVRALVMQRLPCSPALTDHPSVQVCGYPEGGPLSVGLLGILNGLFGANEAGWGPITAVVEDDGRISSFVRTKATIAEPVEAAGGE